jgi:GTP cyclohydrolase I
MDLKKIEEGIRLVLQGIGEDTEREGLKETPERVARMYEEVFCGIAQDPKEILDITFNEKHEEMVLVKNIPLYSFCEHHLLPFYGQAHVAYIPREGKITGISKLARVIECYAKRPQLQERLTSQIADCLMENLNPRGALVVIEAEHMCMTMRGVQKPGSVTVTSAVRGIFRSNALSRSEAMQLIKGGN